MADTCARWDDAEIVERFLPPFKKSIPLQIALIFAINVHLKRARSAEFVNHHRMVNDQINRIEWVNLLGFTAQGDDTVAHRGQIDHGRYASKILHQHPCRTIGNFARVFTTVLGPVRKRFNIVDINRFTILKP